MMRSAALKGNDRIWHYKSITYRPTDWQTAGNLSTATATFGGRCARELFRCYPLLLCLQDHLHTCNFRFCAFFTKALQKGYIHTDGRTDGRTHVLIEMRGKEEKDRKIHRTIRFFLVCCKIRTFKRIQMDGWINGETDKWIIEKMCKRCSIGP